MIHLPKLISVFVLSIFLGCTIAIAEAATNDEDLSATINYLLSFVEQSDFTFIRNNKAYAANEAVRHMRRKYAHFKNEIKTPEDFIRLSASKSLISGKPYMIRTKAGQLMKSETWLLDALEKYRQKRQAKSD